MKRLIFAVLLGLLSLANSGCTVMMRGQIMTYGQPQVVIVGPAPVRRRIIYGYGPVYRVYPQIIRPVPRYPYR